MCENNIHKENKQNLKWLTKLVKMPDICFTSKASCEYISLEVT